MFSVPAPRWVCLKTADGKLLARFDTQRCLLEIVQRGQLHYFDLLRISLEPAPPPTPAVLPEGTSEKIESGI